MKGKFGVLALLAFLLMPLSMANATVYTFGDLTRVWGVYDDGTYMPGWDSSTAWLSGDPAYDSADYVGHPDITGGQVTVDDHGFITDLTFYYQVGPNTVGDVFIDVDADYNWDYVISRGTYWVFNLPRGIYKVNPGFTFSAKKGVNDNYYYMSDRFYNNGYRPDHPVYASNTTLTNGVLTQIDNDIVFTDFNSSLDPIQITGLDGIYVGNNPFIIAFQPKCANDLLMEKINGGGTTVPEPITLIFLGFGLIGIATTSRKVLLK